MDRSSRSRPNRVPIPVPRSSRKVRNKALHIHIQTRTKTPRDIRIRICRIQSQSGSIRIRHGPSRASRTRSIRSAEMPSPTIARQIPIRFPIIQPRYAYSKIRRRETNCRRIPPSTGSTKTTIPKSDSKMLCPGAMKTTKIPNCPIAVCSPRSGSC